MEKTMAASSQSPTTNGQQHFHLPFMGTDRAKDHLATQYNGKWSVRERFRRPAAITADQLDDRMRELEDARGVYRKRRYRNPEGDNSHEKYPDLDTYYSTNKEIPRRLAVQATPEAHNDPRPRHWGLRKIKGHLPLVIRLAEFCLNPLGYEYDDEGDDDDDDEDYAIPREKQKEKKSWGMVMRDLCRRTVHALASTVCTMLLAWIIQLMLSIQIVTAPWTDDGSTEPYAEYENVQWYWPKHAVNPLDQAPNNDQPQSQVARLAIPRRLVVKDAATGQWVAKKTNDLRDPKTGLLPPYIFLSFSRGNFLGKSDEALRPFFDRVAEGLLAHENEHGQDEEPVRAFWVDVYCVSHASDEQRTRDVHTICDAVRCAKRVYVVLPNDDPEHKKIWGARIWTLPEVLLAADKIRYCFSSPPAAGEGSDSQVTSRPHELTLTDMLESFWPGSSPESWKEDDDDDEKDRRLEQQHEEAIGHLINHYSNSTKLTELQLFTCAVQALAERAEGKSTEGYTTTDLAYAAMGLLAYRITPNASDNAFQAIARLSLVNDSNRLLERLACLWPHPATKNDQEQDLIVAGSEELLRNIADRDQYAVHLWDIQPMCDVVGIGDDPFTPTVILDRCRAIPIRWKDFPKIKYVKDLNGFRATISQKIVYCGAWFLATGFGLFASAIALLFSVLPYDNSSNNSDDRAQRRPNDVQPAMYLLGVALFMGCGWVISWFSPWAVRQLCNGGYTGVSCHLVGFEGTMPLGEIEKAICGFDNNRFSYAASSTIFSKNLRHVTMRAGRVPGEGGWAAEAERLGVPPGHRLFTIVDTGNWTVSVIAAERPPVVALICGREGGMLRALLCSWRFENNCLYRECVVRMRSSLEHLATPNDWLKVSLACQGAVARTRVNHRRLEKSQKPAPSPQVAV
ncbi:uncharacterized protein CDV56_106674 [Aspergillus thermomutatus]|uniref:Heterokaryon incompatibility domain-containing protein n=1 Tax=Aspergillus thermomutatus TaxID=41047 RepID=A0A397H7M1_ASPTH|nr:uncharacterized protein CDV56_106674 [Aspergillus thermomutatus]RHZ57684.1 hypothetical protein CDV56_106674 [Aspergillus thermomutatus]